MDMDEVVAVADTSQAKDHLGRNHRRCSLHERIGTHDTRLLGEDDVVYLSVVRGTKHIAGVASFIETLREYHHHLLYAPSYGVELP